MIDVWIQLVVYGFAIFVVYLWFVYKESRSVNIDLNAGIESAIVGPVDISAIRRNPHKLEELRGKIVTIGFNRDVILDGKGRIAESFAIDSNGATVTLESTFEGPGSLDPADSRRGPFGLFSNRHFSTHERNALVEENARWLAAALDVPFEE